jgi:predicted transcriptional regulator of viral defense system
MKPHLNLKKSHVGVELVRLLAAEGQRIFSVDQARELISKVGLKSPYLWEALYHLRRNGWIVPLRRGLYALASTFPGVTPAHEFEVAMALVNPAAISHWSALHYHGLTEQPPRKVFVLTTTEASVPRAKTGRNGDIPIGDTIYRFVRTKPARFFGTERVWVGEARVTITNPERTLIDGLMMPQHFGDFAEVLHAFEVRGDRLDVDLLIGYSLRLDAATAKRLGWVLEKQGVETARLERLAEVPVSGYRTLDATGPRKGPCNRRWMIQENLPGRVRT